MSRNIWLVLCLCWLDTKFIHSLEDCPTEQVGVNISHECTQLEHCDETFTFSRHCQCHNNTLSCQNDDCVFRFNIPEESTTVADEQLCLNASFIMFPFIEHDGTEDDEDSHEDEDEEEEDENEEEDMREECEERLSIIDCNRSNAIKCPSSDYCISTESFCDGYACCPNATDEIRVGPGFKCFLQGQKSTNRCALPQDAIYANKSFCANSEDECFKTDKNGNEFLNKEKCFECKNKQTLISVYQVCDGVVDCMDLSDECFCSHIKINPKICDVMYNLDAPDDICEYGTGNMMSCGNGHCISTSQICNNITDCSDGRDEAHCIKKFPTIVQNNDTTLNTTYDVIQCALSHEPYEWVMEGKSSTVDSEDDDSTIILANVCDGKIECSNAVDECNDKCQQPLPNYCSVDTKCVHGPDFCDGIWQSERTCGRIKEEEENCTNRFYCKSGHTLSIPNYQVCDFISQCEDRSDEMDCGADWFYCENPNDKSKDGGKYFFVPFKRVRDGKKDCVDGSDECPKMYESKFSSNKQLISNLFFRIILWPMAIIGGFGNFAVLCYSWTTMKDKRTDNSVKKAHHLLATSLSFSDLLMTVYLLPLAVMSVIYSGSYCGLDKMWRGSFLCGFIGTFAVISSEVSVITLNLMGAFRLYTVYRPITTQYSKKLERIVFVSVCAAWIIGILLGVIPWLPQLNSYFVQNVWVKSPYFNSTLVSVSDLYDLARKTRKLAMFENITFGSDLRYDIRTIQDTFRHAHVAVEIKSWYGFYQQNGLCLPQLYTKPGNAGWLYTLCIITFNILGFINIVVLYTLFIRKTVKTTNKLNKGRPKNKRVMQCHMQKRVTRLLFTDFMCWVPICIMAYVFVAGKNIPDSVYPISAIILLPINSSLNPILYSSLPEIACNILKRKKRIKRDLMDSGTSRTLTTRVSRFFKQVFEADKVASDFSSSSTERGTSLPEEIGIQSNAL